MKNNRYLSARKVVVEIHNQMYDAAFKMIDPWQRVPKPNPLAREKIIYWAKVK